MRASKVGNSNANTGADVDDMPATKAEDTATPPPSVVPKPHRRS